MDEEELVGQILVLKKEIDETSLYYSFLLERKKSINKILFANNKNNIQVNNNEKKENNEDFSDSDKEFKAILIRAGFAYIFYIFFWWLRDCGIISSTVNYFCTVCTFSIYCYPTFTYYSRKRREINKNSKIEIDALEKEYEDLSKEITYIQDKLYFLNKRYDKEVNKLSEIEYREYLESVSVYLKGMLDNSEYLLENVKMDYNNQEQEYLEYNEKNLKNRLKSYKFRVNKK